MWNWEKTITINLDSENLWEKIYLRQSYFLIKGVILQPRDLRFGRYGIHGKVLFWSINAQKKIIFIFYLRNWSHWSFLSLLLFRLKFVCPIFLPQFLFKKKERKRNEVVFLLYALSTSSFSIEGHFANCSLMMKSILFSLSALILLVILFQRPIRYAKS